MWGRLGGHLGLSEALLEPSWAEKDPLTPLGAGVNPSPEQGKEEVLAERRQSSLNHLRPEGWCDYEGCLVNASGRCLASRLAWRIIDGLTVLSCLVPSFINHSAAVAIAIAKSFAVTVETPPHDPWWYSQFEPDSTQSRSRLSR